MNRRIDLDSYLKEEKGIEVVIDGEVIDIPVPSVREGFELEKIVRDMEDGKISEIEGLELILSKLLREDIVDKVIDNLPITKYPVLITEILTVFYNVAQNSVYETIEGVEEKVIEIEGDKKKIPR